MQWVEDHRARISGLIALVLVGLLVALGAWAGASDELVTHSGHLPLWTFIGVAVVLAGFILVVGWGITGKVLGFLIDGSKGRMSLSTLQVSLWTVLVLAAYYNAFAVNLALGPNVVSEPLSVTIPAGLLTAMGISIAALAGSGLVQSVKGSQDSGLPEEGGGVQSSPPGSPPGSPPASPPEASPAAFAETRVAEVKAEFRTRANDQTLPIDASKNILRIAGVEAASWRDLFEGEGPLAATTLDLGKVQMFFFTVVLVLGYAVTVGNLFGDVDPTKGVTALPQLDQAFAGLLTISQIGYLATKANTK